MSTFFIGLNHLQPLFQIARIAGAGGGLNTFTRALGHGDQSTAWRSVAAAGKS